MSIPRAILVLAMVVFGVFYLMLAAGGGSFVNECTSVICGQLHQAIFSAIGAGAILTGAYRVIEGRPGAAQIVFSARCRSSWCTSS